MPPTTRVTAIALSTTLIAAILPNPRADAQMALPAGAQGCLSNAYCAIGLIVLGGITYWSVTQGGATT
jgi:hypothetical protein